MASFSDIDLLAMAARVHHHDRLIYPVGTQVVVLKEILGQSGRVLHPRGAVGVVVKSPVDLTHAYRVRFADSVEESLLAGELVSLARYKEGDMGEDSPAAMQQDLFERVIYRCVIGSRAYGLEEALSDTDRRGIYLPPAARHWSLHGVPEQLENEETQESYWELQKFLVLALKANPNVLECLYSPLVETATPLAQELLDMRECFLSRVVYQTYNGYVMSQFKKIEGDLRNHGQAKPKHVMHLIRLLLAGVRVLNEGYVPVRVYEYREELLAIRRGDLPWEEVQAWRASLHEEFDRALARTTLPERPDYQRADAFLIQARRAATRETLP